MPKAVTRAWFSIAIFLQEMVSGAECASLYGPITFLPTLRHHGRVQADALRERMSVHEYMCLLRSSGLIGRDLTDMQLLEALGMAMLGGDGSQLAEWVEEAKQNPLQLHLLYDEFIESLLRAAFTKYSHDKVASADFKAHEFCQVKSLHAFKCLSC